MRTVSASWNDKAKCHQFTYDGILRELPESAPYQLKNEHKTPYGWGQVEVDYGDGQLETVSVMVWGTNIENGTFDELIDKKVAVRVNHDGDFPGLSTLALSAGRFDTSRVTVVLPKAVEEEVPATT